MPAQGCIVGKAVLHVVTAVAGSRQGNWDEFARRCGERFGAARRRFTVCSFSWTLPYCCFRG